MSNALHVALAVLALVGVAHAQTEDSFTLTLTSSALVDNDRLLAGGPDCANIIGGALNLNGTLDGTFADYELRLTWTTGTAPCDRGVFSTCSNASDDSTGETCGCITEVSETTTISSSNLSFSDLLDNPCSPADGVTEYDVRFFVEYFNTTDSSTATSAALVVTFDFDPPAAPSGDPTVSSGDSALTVSFQESADDDIDRYQVCYSRTGAPTCENTTDTTHRIEGLENDVAYTIYVQAIDFAGNVSSPGSEVFGTPEESQDFAEFYSNIPGQAKGCTAQPGSDGPAWLWALLPLLALGRRRRTTALLMGIAIVALAQPALARGEEETPREAVFEFRMGSYLPNIDKEFGSACDTQNCPYASAFESGDPFMLTFSYSKLVFTGFGSLAVGGGFGYWNNDEGRAIKSNPTDTLDFADETTEISVYPLFLEIAYRLDVIQDIIPLVPALRVGVDAYGWRIFDGAGEVARFKEFGTDVDAGAAQGFSFGWHASLGVHILLDYFAPGMAADFDRDAGVNNSYLTLDFQTSQISNFGGGETLWLGSDTLFIGLALDM